ncbi:MAG: UDP-4-amino-4,6-dideoxy-N-acetyl-beta-L-altrosamine transaminase [Candidatus Micrarchaeota archaeon]
MEKLAIEGGTPVRKTYLPYGRHDIRAQDIAAVVQVLKSDWITQGPACEKFESDFKKTIGCTNAAAVSNGTAALHLAMLAAGAGKGDEVITSPLTFAASANAALYCGATPVFADVSEKTLNIDPDEIEKKITARTKAIVPVHYAGLPCDLKAIYEIAESRGLRVIEDCAHSLGAEYHGARVGSESDIAIFSFHPVKQITSGEGGMVVCKSAENDSFVRKMRSHGISKQVLKSHENSQWRHDMTDLGFNYRMTDFQCALGSSQLKRLPEVIRKRTEIADFYRKEFKGNEFVTAAPVTDKNAKHAWHLYVIRLKPENLCASRDRIFSALRAENIGVNVHYLPVYMHEYYRLLGYAQGQCPNAETAFENMLTLPLFPTMTLTDAKDVVRAVEKVTERFSK